MFSMDPYQELIALIKIANEHDNHIKNLVHNQKTYTNVINDLGKDILALEKRLTFIEEKLHETSRKKR